VIVGGGIAGLLTARYIENNEVTVLESLPRIGYRKHCAGIISVSTCRLLNADDFADEWYDRAEIVTPLGVVDIRCRKPFAVHIDRCAHENAVAAELEDRGHRIVLRANVMNIEKRNQLYEIVALTKSGVKKFVAEKLVLAEGFSRRLSERMGLQCVRKTLVGAQLLVELNARLREGFMKILFDENTVENGFLWHASLSGGRKAMIGIVGEPPIRKPMEMLVRISKRVFGLDVSKIVDFWGGHVFAGYPIVAIRRNVAAVGDCVAMVKSLSGGGLYGISRAAPALARILERGAEVKSMKMLHDLFKRLRNQYLMAMALHGIFKRVPRSSARPRFEITLDYLDYDNHIEVLYTVMKTIGSERMRIRWSAEVSLGED